MAKSIAVDDLHLYYKDFLAVEGVTMTIPAKQVTAFIGPSGCGKSTFLRSLNRMHEVTPGARVEGKVMIDGQSLYDPSVDPAALRRQIGMVFQRANPFPKMSIAENVLAGNRLNNKRLGKNEADEGGERGGCMKNDSSEAYEGQIGQVDYADSKGGIVGRTLPAARDLASRGVPVVTIAP